MEIEIKSIWKDFEAVCSYFVDLNTECANGNLSGAIHSLYDAREELGVALGKTFNVNVFEEASESEEIMSAKQKEQLKAKYFAFKEAYDDLTDYGYSINMNVGNACDQISIDRILDIKDSLTDLGVLEEEEY